MAFLISWLWLTWTICGVNFGFSMPAFWPLLFVSLGYIWNIWWKEIK